LLLPICSREMLNVNLLLQVTFTFKAAGTNNVVTLNPAVTCTTDATGFCKATVPASSTAVAYDVTASSLCQSTPVTSTSSTINWVASGANSLLQVVVQPTKNVGQTNEVQGFLQCNGNMQPGSVVSGPK
jgi:hypothetical protein